MLRKFEQYRKPPSFWNESGAQAQSEWERHTGFLAAKWSHLYCSGFKCGGKQRQRWKGFRSLKICVSELKWAVALSQWCTRAAQRNPAKHVVRRPAMFWGNRALTLETGFPLPRGGSTQKTQEMLQKWHELREIGSQCDWSPVQNQSRRPKPAERKMLCQELKTFSSYSSSLIRGECRALLHDLTRASTLHSLKHM